MEIENERGLLLSKASLSEDMPIYVLDAVSAVLVLYTNNALNSDPKLPYPPPHTCALRKQIKAVEMLVVVATEGAIRQGKE